MTRFSMIQQHAKRLFRRHFSMTTARFKGGTLHLVSLILCLALAFPSMVFGQTQCVLTEVDEDGTPTKGRCEERPQGKGDDSDTWWAVAAGVVVVGGVSAYILTRDDEDLLLRLQRYNAWMREHTESDERGISFKLFEW